MNCNVKTRMAWKEAVLEIFSDTRQGKGTIDKIIEKTRDSEINSNKQSIEHTSYRSISLLTYFQNKIICFLFIVFSNLNPCP